MKTVFSRVRFIQNKQPENLGDFNVSIRRSHENKHIILSLHSKEESEVEDDEVISKNEIHCAFYPDRAEQLYFRLRYQLECMNNIATLEENYANFIREIETEKQQKNTKGKVAA